MAPPLAAQDAAPAPVAEAPAQAPAAADAAPSAASAQTPAPMPIPASKTTTPDAGAYAFDPAHSQAVFTYDHMGFSTSRGFVNGIEGTITLDPADPAKSSVEASFPLSALQTLDAGLDKLVMGPDFFNVTGDAPLVTFKSTSVEPDGDDEARVTGDLTLNGITRPVVLEVEFNGAGLDPITQVPTIGFSIEAELKRSDFNLGGFSPAVEDEVEIDIEIEAKKQS
ncbi:polyisoprenoid-binding protein [Paracoccus sp. S1E-3]|nr:polyisoprenoid-binding protein [Paracoccus sp. S1E-3]